MSESGSIDGRELAHGLLIAVLMKLGGSIELDLEEVQPDVTGDTEGRIYGFAMEPGSQPGSVRISVRAETNHSEG